jgi:hypothetical protein
MIQISNPRDAQYWQTLRREALLKLAEQRTAQGLAPPPEVYRIEYRRLIDWSKFPSWARPVDPQMFDGCCHEG